jgi:hypothetical protein
MEEIRVKDLSIKVKATKDSHGRRGYFIAEADLRKNRKIEVVRSIGKKISQPNKLSPEAKEILDELRDYKYGKTKLRTLDEFLKTL